MYSRGKSKQSRKEAEIEHPDADNGNNKSKKKRNSCVVKMSFLLKTFKDTGKHARSCNEFYNDLHRNTRSPMTKLATILSKSKEIFRLT